MIRSLFLYLLLHLLSFQFVTGQGTLLNDVGAGSITIENCRGINSPGADFAPAFYRDRLVYLTQPRRGVSLGSRQPDFELYAAPHKENQLTGQGELFTDALGSGEQGPVCFTQDDGVIYFTRTLAGGAENGAAGKASVGLFSAYDDGSDWAAIRPLPHNDPDFTNQHPTLTPDGRRLFFSSNRPGGFGGYDLYFADYRDGNWGAAINLGAEVNTDGNEAFPHVHLSGNLFFASDGHPGLGGYDLFRIDVGGRAWGELVSLPAPINSAADDITFVLNATATTAYLASNRPGGLGNDDIYRVTLRDGLSDLRASRASTKPITIYDAATSKRLNNARVTIAELSESGRLPATLATFALEESRARKMIVQQPLPPGHGAEEALYTGVLGQLSYEFRPDRRYHLTVTRPGYRGLAFYYRPGEDTSPGLLDLAMEPGDCQEIVGRVVNEKMGAVAGAKVIWRVPNEEPQPAGEATSDLGGYYTVCLQPGRAYTASATLGGITSDVLTLAENTFTGGSVPSQVLRGAFPSEGNTLYGNLMDAVLPLPDIEYPYLSANPIPERSPDLDVLVSFVRNFTGVRILLIVHADGPEAKSTLQRLTEERAVRLRNHLVVNGVPPDQIRTVAYGNRFRLNACTDCQATDYSANTRIEAKVIAWD
ncbi:OmpA family protein [Neolewinella antarctica]|uniref:Outer membrane protein OmpA-like peptidoglycan-associated protein n=1 Tax=Neolewinella antarctica TaxID=442734 RepID=A0ABX0XEK7_9BACT|nr:PD40 domain-containing protein [Neolewinella antarctica]NJC27228.1 outer membrane protein OmpA-like peptidoglycan-associated protein [Neolewinella antarctica]